MESPANERNSNAVASSPAHVWLRYPRRDPDRRIVLVREISIFAYRLDSTTDASECHVMKFPPIVDSRLARFSAANNSRSPLPPPPPTRRSIAISVEPICRNDRDKRSQGEFLPQTYHSRRGIVAVVPRKLRERENTCRRIARRSVANLFRRSKLTCNFLLLFRHDAGSHTTFEIPKIVDTRVHDPRDRQYIHFICAQLALYI